MACRCNLVREVHLIILWCCIFISGFNIKLRKRCNSELIPTIRSHQRCFRTAYLWLCFEIGSFQFETLIRNSSCLLLLCDNFRNYYSLGNDKCYKKRTPSALDDKYCFSQAGMTIGILEVIPFCNVDRKYFHHHEFHFECGN